MDLEHQINLKLLDLFDLIKIFHTQIFSFTFFPVAIRYDGKAPSEGHGFQLHVGPMRSESRGYVRIQSSNPLQAPTIKFNYMSHESDFPTPHWAPMESS